MMIVIMMRTAATIIEYVLMKMSECNKRVLMRKLEVAKKSRICDLQQSTNSARYLLFPSEIDGKYSRIGEGTRT